MIEPYFQDDMVALYNGNCEDVLPQLSGIHACVTDPPYGLSFMGKKWDYDVPGEDVWRECLRVLKPGGHLLAFAGTRTQHRMAVNIEDAGFEIRDMIAWVYGSGFPKSMNVGKAIDKAAGVEREVVGIATNGAGNKPNGNSFDDDNYEWKKQHDITVSATEAGRQWEGWGTAMKPAFEPISVCRKPFPGTVVANVLAHGTGGLNIDGCRVGTDEAISNHSRSVESAVSNGKYGDSCEQQTHHTAGQSLGRWPANLIHDGSDEVVGLFPDVKAGVAVNRNKNSQAHSGNQIYGKRNAVTYDAGFGGSGSAARFFYCPKANKKDRNSGGVTNSHPTVKPLELMRYLCRLVTPPGGTILDPFMGSGSTGKAAVMEGFKFIGIERDEEYCRIAMHRILDARKKI